MDCNLESVFDTRDELCRAVGRLRSRISASPGNPALRISYASLLYIAGYFDQAEREARGALRLDGSRWQALEILGRTLYLKGRFHDAMGVFRKIIRSRTEPGDTCWRLAQCLLRMNDYRRAARVLEEHGVTHPLASLVHKIAEKPAFQFAGNSTTTVPIVQLDPLPVIEIKVNAEKAFAFLDTGGPGFSTNVEFAEKKGLPVISSEMGNYAFRKNAPVKNLQIDSVSLGEITLLNVPGFALQGIRPKFGRHICEVCVGTGILGQFLSTIDYRNHKLILSKRDAPKARKEHFRLLGRRYATAPFFMASDHCLIAKGFLNGRKDLTLLVDSGLAAFGRPTPDDPLRQAAFMTWQGALAEYGIVGSQSDVAFPYFWKIGSLGLGPLVQHGLYGFVKSREGERLRLDGVMIDGLISHAFLRHYTWTADFDRYEFVFTE